MEKSPAEPTCSEAGKSGIHPAGAQQLHVIERIFPGDHPADQRDNFLHRVRTLAYRYVQLTLDQQPQSLRHRLGIRPGPGVNRAKLIP